MNRILSTQALFTTAMLALSACGGSGGGTADTTAATNSPGSYFEFAGDGSDIVAVASGAPDRPAMVLMNADNGAVSRTVFVDSDTATLIAEFGSDGNVDRVVVGEHRLEFGDFEPESVSVTYFDPSGSSVGYVISRQDEGDASSDQSSASKTVSARPAAKLTNEELDELIDKNLIELSDLFETYLPLQILRDVGESIRQPFNRAKAAFERLQARTAEARQTIGNRINCAIDDNDCAVVIARDAEQVVDSTRAVDPSGSSSARFDVSDDGTVANSEEWNDDELNGDFESSTASCNDPYFRNASTNCAGDNGSADTAGDDQSQDEEPDSDPGQPDDGGDTPPPTDDDGAAPTAYCMDTDTEQGFQTRCYSDTSIRQVLTRRYVYLQTQPSVFVEQQVEVCYAIEEVDDGSFPDCTDLRQWFYDVATEEAREAGGILVGHRVSDRSRTGNSTLYNIDWVSTLRAQDTHSSRGQGFQERERDGRLTRCFYNNSGEYTSYRIDSADRQEFEQGRGPCPITPSPGGISPPPRVPPRGGDVPYWD